MRVVKRTDAAVTDPATRWLLSLLADLRLHLHEKTLPIQVAQQTTHLVYLGLFRTVVAYLLTDTLAPPSGDITKQYDLGDWGSVTATLFQGTGDLKVTVDFSNVMDPKKEQNVFKSWFDLGVPDVALPEHDDRETRLST